MRPSYPYSALMSPREGSEHVLEVDGTETHWWEFSASKNAPTLVLIHGFRGDHHGLQLIGDALPEFRIVIPDLPAFGSSTPWRQGVRSIDDYTRWLRAFLQATGTTDAVVVGHSFGSIVVAHALTGKRNTPIVLINPISQLALTGPKRVAAAVAGLWYSIGGALPESWGRAWLGNRLFVRAMSGMLAKTPEPRLRAWIHDQHARYFSAFSDRAALLGAFAVSTSVTVADVASDVTAPVLLVVADEDDITPLSAQIDIQTVFPDAELHVLSGVGHLVHYEKPIETAAAIRDFLERRGRRP